MRRRAARKLQAALRRPESMPESTPRDAAVEDDNGTQLSPGDSQVSGSSALATPLSSPTRSSAAPTRGQFFHGGTPSGMSRKTLRCISQGGPSPRSRHRQPSPRAEKRSSSRGPSGRGTQLFSPVEGSATDGLAPGSRRHPPAKSEEELMGVAALHFRAGELSRGWRGWAETWEQAKRARGQLERAARHVLRRDLTRGWLRWAEVYRTHTALMSKLQVAATRLVHHNLIRGLSSWVRWLAWRREQQARERSLRVAAATMRNPGLLPAFAFWSSQARLLALSQQLGLGPFMVLLTAVDRCLRRARWCARMTAARYSEQRRATVPTPTSSNSLQA